MELDSSSIIKVFTKNNLGKACDTDFGKAIIIDSYKAFLLSCITDTGYIINEEHPRNFFSQLKIFNSVNEYNLIAGLYNNQNKLEFKNTPNVLCKKYDFINNTEKKYILPTEFDNEKEFQEKVKKLFKNCKDPTNYLFLRIDKSKKCFCLVNLLVFFAIEYFIKKNYITETQIPISHSGGVPDIGIYNNFISNKGFNVIELSMLKAFPNKLKIYKKNSIKFYSSAGEAKALSSYDITKRLAKYLSSNLFDNLFGIYPDKKKLDKFKKLGISLFFIDEDWSFRFFEGNYYKQFIPQKKSEYKRWFNNYLKFYLLSSYENKNIENFLDKKKLKKKDIKGFIGAVIETTLEELYDYI